MHSLSAVGNDDRPKPYIDVMENVFGGVRISPEDEPPAEVSGPDPRPRPWLTGVSMDAVEVTLADEDSDTEKPDH